jgi:predicted phosphodiesterase
LAKADPVRIAVVADIHGNVRALEAVLKDLKHQSPDAVVNLGDCVSGPLWPEETAALLRDLDWPTVRGNHDRVVAAGAVPSDNRTDSFTEAALSPRSAAWLGTLQPAIRFSDEVFLCHGTPRNDNTYLTEDVVDGGARVSAEHRIAGRLEGRSLANHLLWTFAPATPGAAACLGSTGSQSGQRRASGL